MKCYKLTTADGGVDMTLTYGDDEFLTKWEVNKPCVPTYWRMLWKYPPVRLGILRTLMHTFEGTFELAEVPTDLSFKVFWDAYQHKVGSKPRAEKLWNALPEADRVAALAAVPKYLFFLATKRNMEQAFAETWLNQRRWEGFAS